MLGLLAQTFATMLTRIVLKPHHLPFNIQQITVNISSPFIVTRTFVRHCGLN